jgi:23S rRNA pseudouridine1911/1915/1917 synthase
MTNKENQTPKTIEGRKPTFFPLDILFEDEALIAVQKPALMLVIPDRFDAEKPTVFDAVWYHLCQREPNKKIEELLPRLVHRLDQGTSGVLLFAKTFAAQRALTQDFEQGRVQKCYWAIVVGEVARDKFVIDKPLGPLKKKKGLMMVDPTGKESKTEVEVIERMPAHSLVMAYPKTGRQHQIRVHLASEGHPLANDPSYRRAPAEEYISAECPRLTLHARSLTLQHPTTKKSLSIEAPLPKDFNAAILACRQASKR